MNLWDFLKTWKGTRQENRFQRGVNAVLAVGVVIIGAKAWSNDTIVTFVPPTLNEEVRVARHSADEGYIKSWGLYLATLMGNTTPGNVGVVRDVLSPLLASAVFQPTMQALAIEIEEIKRDRVSKRFEPKAVLYETATQKVFVSGTSYSKGVVGEEKSNAKTFEFKIRMTEYRPVIQHVETYVGEPRTQKEIDRLERMKERQQKIEEKRQKES
jgi:conjugal transfer pilus assembly protein TraE